MNKLDRIYKRYMRAGDNAREWDNCRKRCNRAAIRISLYGQSHPCPWANHQAR